MINEYKGVMHIMTVKYIEGLENKRSLPIIFSRSEEQIATMLLQGLQVAAGRV